MSVLETPRILFRGGVTWDPIVTNNYDALYDEAAAETVLPDAAGIAAEVQAFRKEAIAAVMPLAPGSSAPNRNWNPHGTHRSSFYDTCISGVDVGAGAVTDDPFVGSAANFTGMLVDLEPYGGFTSQLFFDSMQFGVDGGYRITLPRTARFTDRGFNLARNAAGYITGFFSISWQSSFAKADGLTIDAQDSPALQALQAVLAEPETLGLTVRWVAYCTIYYDTPELASDVALRDTVAQGLIDKLNDGGFQPNPARSSIVGMIGPWRAGEPPHEAGDRALLPNVQMSRPGVTSIQGAQARFDGNRLAIDLSNSTPETGLDLAKDTSFGDLTVVAVDPATKEVVATLGTIPTDHYDRAAYERTSGVVTLTCDPAAVAAAASADIVVNRADGSPVLTETPLRAIATTPNLYLDEGDRATASFQLYERGVPAVGPAPVTLYTINFDGSTVLGSASLMTDRSGLLSVPVAATEGEVFAYVPAPDNLNPPLGGIDPQANTFMYIRVLPADAATAALPPTWDNVYARVLSNWNAMAPCMDNWLMLDDPERVKAYGPLLKKLTAQGTIENYRYMPVTRDMSAGARTLLYAFLDTPDAPVVGAAIGEAAPLDASPGAERIAIIKSTRRP